MKPITHVLLIYGRDHVIFSPQMTFAKYSFLSLTLLALTACTNVDQSKQTSNTIVQHNSGLPTAQVTQTSVQGKWKTACLKSANKGNYIAEMVLSAGASADKGVMETTTTSYFDTNCENAVYTEDRVSNYSVDTSTDVALLNESFVTVRYTANGIGTSLFNQNKFCGSTDWNDGVPQVFTTATECGLSASIAFHAALYGSKELYLKDCTGDSDTNCTHNRFQKE